MVSVINAPENSVPKDNAMIVTTGRSAFLSAWRTTTRLRVAPLAKAVRM